MIIKRIFLFTLLGVLLLIQGTTAASISERSLVVMEWPTAVPPPTHLPFYSHLPHPNHDYLLIGATETELTSLANQEIQGQRLETPNLQGNYYLAYLMPGQTEPAWSAYGRLVWHDGRSPYLLHLTPNQTSALAATGVKLAAITLTPKQWPALTAPPAQASFDPVPTIQQMIDQVDSGTINQYTGDLSGEWPTDIGGTPYTIVTRNTYSGQPIEKATEYVGQHLSNLGLAVEYHQWSGSTYPNVIGQITGTTNPDQIFILSAHLDDMPSGAVAPGADDNASGTAAVLLAADILSQYQWGCTLRFGLWTGEEQGLLGSAVYAQRAVTNNENILGVLNVDMIGWNTIGSSPDIDLHARSTVPGSVALAQLFADVVSAYSINLVPQVIDYGSGASDHASFWNQGYPAFLGIEDYYGTGDFNPYYHTTQDLLANIDMNYFTEFVKATVGTMVHMSDCLIVDQQTGMLTGAVQTAVGQTPLPDAQLNLSASPGTTFTTTTALNGTYSLTLPVDSYTATVSHPGYYPQTVSRLLINTNTTTNYTFNLEQILFELLMPYLQKE